LFILKVSAQPDIDHGKISYHTKSFVGIGHGINAYTGMIGLMMEYPVDDHFSIFFAGGLGSWGFKAGSGIAAYLIKPSNGPSISVGYCYAHGFKNYMTSLETTSGEYEYVTMILQPVNNIHAVFYYNIPIGRASKMMIGTGYSIKLRKNAWEITSNHNLTDNSKQMMSILQPGGPVISFAYCFGMR